VDVNGVSIFALLPLDLVDAEKFKAEYCT